MPNQCAYVYKKRTTLSDIFHSSNFPNFEFHSQNLSNFVCSHCILRCSHSLPTSSLPIMPKRSMSFRRRSNKRRRTSKFVTRRQFPVMLMNLAEPKYIDIESVYTPIFDIVPEQLDFTTFSEGTGVSQRVGREIQVTGFYGQILAKASTTGEFVTNEPSFVRVVLYYPKDVTEPAMTDMPAQLIDKEKFVILADKTVAVSWINSIEGAQIIIKKKFKPYMKVIYDTSSGATVLTHRLQLMISTDITNPQSIQVSYGCRMYFRDV